MVGAISEKSTTVKDMSDAYIGQISNYQKQIDEYWQQSIEEPRIIVYINERMHQLFKKVSPKMDQIEQKRQFFYEKKLQETRAGMFKTKKTINSKDEVINVKIIEPYKYSKFKHLLEKREIEINAALERLGLTATSQEKKRRIH